MEVELELSKPSEAKERAPTIPAPPNHPPQKQKHLIFQPENFRSIQI